MTDSQDRGPQRPGRRDDAPRSGSSGPRSSRPTGSGRPTGAGRPPRDGENKLWTSDGKPARNDRRAGNRMDELSEEEKQARALRSVRTRHDDPEIPEKVTAKDLDRIARNELKTLSKENAEEVARHLAMAAQLIESDPELAHRHAVSASRRAGRIGVVRETLAITAYATGDFALAIRELRTYRRISGSNEQLALMVDSERGVGRPDRALEVGRSVIRSELSVPVQVAVAIAMSGARLDMGQAEAALGELEIAQLDPNVAFSYSAELFAAYAEVLEELGRTEDAELWRDRADRADIAMGDDEEDLIEVFEEDEEFEDFDTVVARASVAAAFGAAAPDASDEVPAESTEEERGDAAAEHPLA